MGTSRLGKTLIILSLLLTEPAAILPAPARAQTQQNSQIEARDKRVNILVIHSYHPGLSWTKKTKEGIEEGFQQSPHQTTVFHEFLDAKRYPNLHHKNTFLEGIRNKYQHTDIDLLMVADDPGLNLVFNDHKKYFADLPVVFLGINHIQDKFLNKPWLTGVFESHSIAETLIEAKRQTGVNHMIVISDSTETGKASQKKLRSIQSTAGIADNIHLLEDVMVSNINKKVGSYPDEWPIFMFGQLRTGAKNGPLLSFTQEAKTIHSYVKNPIYIDNTIRFHDGAIGGKLLDANYHAKQAVKLANKILDGASPDQVPPILKGKNKWIFNAQALEAANISLKSLPAGSTLTNRRLSFYEENYRIVWLTLSLFVLSLITIAILSNAIRRQKNAEEKLRANEKQLEHIVQERTAELQEALSSLQHSQSETEERSLELAKKNSELEIARLAADKANQAKSDFLAKMSHELRTPLNSILGFTQLLQQDQILPTKQQKFLDTIASSGSHLLNLINNILDLSKVQAGKSRLTKKDFHIEALLESVCKMLEPEAAKKGISLFCHCEKGFPKYIHQDESKIKQIVINLLGNAVKFTSLGQVSLIAEAITSNQLKFTIADTGPGISEQDLERLFKPFSQTQVGELHEQGTGLGLSISLEFIKLMGGTIDVKSEVGKGSTFTLLIPFEDAKEESKINDEPSHRSSLKLSPQTGQKRILIVDDHPSSRELFSELFSISGFEVNSAKNGQEAIDLSHQWHPHAILMDVQMPGINGLEATKIIKREVTPEPIIIIFTTDTQQHVKNNAFKSGCDDFLNKPCPTEDLLHAVAKCLNLPLEIKTIEPRHVSSKSSPPYNSIDMPAALAQSLAKLSPTILHQLANAATSLSDEELGNILIDLPVGNELLTAQISNLMTNFRYDLILEMITPHLESSRSPSPLKG